MSEGCKYTLTRVDITTDLLQAFPHKRATWEGTMKVSSYPVLGMGDTDINGQNGAEDNPTEVGLIERKKKKRVIKQQLNSLNLNGTLQW